MENTLYLVTGAAGFLGSTTCRRLVREGKKRAWLYHPPLRRNRQGRDRMAQKRKQNLIFPQFKNPVLNNEHGVLFFEHGLFFRLHPHEPGFVFAGIRMINPLFNGIIPVRNHRYPSADEGTVAVAVPVPKSSGRYPFDFADVFVNAFFKPACAYDRIIFSLELNIASIRKFVVVPIKKHKKDNRNNNNRKNYLFLSLRHFHYPLLYFHYNSAPPFFQ